MPADIESLMVDLLEWIGPTPRPYAEVMEAWRTSCPQLSVWEEALDRGYVERRQGLEGREATVALTLSGATFLRGKRSGAL